MNTDINKIVARKNKGILILEKLDKGLYTDNVFELGDNYVYMKGNRVLNWDSISSKESEVAKVIWYYKVGDKKKVICVYNETIHELVTLDKF